MEKSKLDFIESIKTLEVLTDQFYAGNKSLYRPISTELRKLLCDKNPLLLRVFPGFQLHKLHWTELLEKIPSLKEKLITMMPGRLNCKGDGTYTFKLGFAQSQTLISVDEWIRQPIINLNITIFELIKSVADKEGAHSDIDYNDTLEYAKLVKYVTDDSHIPIIVGIGEYIVAIVKNSTNFNDYAK